MICLMMCRSRQYLCCLVLCFVTVAILLLSCYPVNDLLEIVHVEQSPTNLKKSSAANYSRRLNSTCNKRSDRRGYHQRVVAYTLYGDLTQTDVAHRYLMPLAETTRKIPQLFKGTFL